MTAEWDITVYICMHDGLFLTACVFYIEFILVRKYACI